MDLDIDRAKALIAKRDEIDEELKQLFTGKTAAKLKPQKCSVCGSEGHSARTCPSRPGDPPPPPS